MFAFGSVVLARFPFTDLSGEKRRPALVVSRGDAEQPDVVVCFITSVPRTGPYTVAIPNTAETGLKVPSTVRFDKIATLERSVIAGKIGHAPGSWLEDNAVAFFSVFGFEIPG